MGFLDNNGLTYFWQKIKALIPTTYAGSSTAGGAATKSAGILYGHVNSTSTSTVFTATVDGLTSYYDGACIMLRNGVVTSASGFTLNVNGLGALPVYNNMYAATRETTIFNSAYTMLFVYDSDRVSGGCWVCYRGYDSNSNSIDYQLRSNSIVKPVTDRTRYYRILFSSADDTKWIPANTEYNNSATTAKTVNQRPINPFGEIVYLANTTDYAANANMSATAIWQQYTLTLGYSFNRTGAALTLTIGKPVYVKCAPQSNGSAIMDSTTPIVQDLPTTEDGKIYIFLGVAYSATAIELLMNHPVYYYKDGSIRLWTNAPSSLPAVTASDNGKVLTVSSGAWTAGNAPTELPSVSSSDNGKVLVVSSGAWTAGNLIASDDNNGNVTLTLGVNT